MLPSGFQKVRSVSNETDKYYKHWEYWGLTFCNLMFTIGFVILQNKNQLVALFPLWACVVQVLLSKLDYNKIE